MRNIRYKAGDWKVEEELYKGASNEYLEEMHSFVSHLLA